MLTLLNYYRYIVTLYHTRVYRYSYIVHVLLCYVQVCSLVKSRGRSMKSTTVQSSHPTLLRVSHYHQLLKERESLRGNLKQVLWYIMPFFKSTDEEIIFSQLTNSEVFNVFLSPTSCCTFRLNKRYISELIERR